MEEPAREGAGSDPSLCDSLSGRCFLVVDGSLYLRLQLRRNICKSMILASVLRRLFHHFLLGLPLSYKVTINPYIPTAQCLHRCLLSRDGALVSRMLGFSDHAVNSVRR